MSNHRKISVLVCPLNWGLGHAARTTQVIKHLLAVDAEVVIAADGGPAALLKSFFPDVTHINLKSYNIKYSAGKTQLLKLFFQIPGFLLRRSRDHNYLKRLIKENKIDLVISDNRPGLWNKSVYSVYITHQIMVKLPGIWKVFERAVSFLHRYIEIRHYDECWIPDVPGFPDLSGDLSHRYKLPPNAFFTGLLSRFTPVFNTTEDEIHASGDRDDLLILLSGPEPQRTMLEKILAYQVSQLSMSCVIIRGLPHEAELSAGYPNITYFNHTDDHTFRSLVIRSKYVICRAGYSTLMDLIALKKTALIIPTPGQTEQEYLAEYLSKSGLFFTMKQDEINLAEQLSLLDQSTSRSAWDSLYFMPPEQINDTVKKAALKAEKRIESDLFENNQQKNNQESGT